jgi:flagella basal body P-ring formation protein FlgA
VTVALRARAEPEGRLISIANVAHVEGDEPALVERVGSVLLGASPDPGDVRVIGRDHIKCRLHQEGVSLGSLCFTGEERVAVIAPLGQRAPDIECAQPEITSGDGFISAIRDYVAEELGCARDSIEAELLSLRWMGRPPQLASSDEGARSLVFVVSSRTRGSGVGRARYVVQVLEGGTPAGRAIVWTEVVQYRRGMAPRRPMRPGEIIGAEDVVLATFPVREPRVSLLDDPEEVVGREAARQIRAGEMMVSESVRARTLVEAGEIVTVLVETESYKIADRARACRAGAKGQVITVENLRSRKTYLARVIDEQMVAAVP